MTLKSALLCLAVAGTLLTVNAEPSSAACEQARQACACPPGSVSDFKCEESGGSISSSCACATPGGGGGTAAGGAGDTAAQTQQASGQGGEQAPTTPTTTEAIVESASAMHSIQVRAAAPVRLSCGAAGLPWPVCAPSLCSQAA